MHLLVALHHAKYAKVYWKIELDHSFDRARSLEIAQKNAQQYDSDHAVHSLTQQIAAFFENRTESQETQQSYIAADNVSQRCLYCGNKKHSRRSCPARYVECYRCSILGHFAKVCLSNGSVWRQQQTDTFAPVMKLTQNTCSLNGLTNITVRTFSLKCLSYCDKHSFWRL